MDSTLKQRAYNHIREMMLTGGLTAGSRVSDLALSRDIGISRTPVREAINQLATEGLIEQIPHMGAFVRRPTRRDVEELIELREVLESYAARRAAERMSRDDLSQLDKLCEDMQALVHHVREEGITSLEGPRRSGWVLNDMAYHMIILRAAGNRRVLKIISDLKIMTQLFGYEREDLTLSNLAWIYAGHRRVLRALKRRDGEMASRLMCAHIQRGKRLALSSLAIRESGTSEGGPLSDAYPDSIRQIIRRIEVYDNGPSPDDASGGKRRRSK